MGRQPAVGIRFVDRELPFLNELASIKNGKADVHRGLVQDAWILEQRARMHDLNAYPRVTDRSV